MEKDTVKKHLRANRINSMDREKVKELKEEIEKKLDELGKIYGLKFEFGNRIKFDENSFEGKIKAKVLSTRSRSTPDEEEFKRYAILYGLNGDFYNSRIKLTGNFSGKTARIVKINRKAKKYPVIAELNDGTKIKVSASFAREQIIK